MVGSQSYLTPRMPTRTTAADCSIRGGEFVAYDRANYKTALAVWMPEAEKGNAEAQVNVGEIFERGLGGAPNYQAAKIWYEKAAAQDNKRAQFNLGTLFEQGLGVPKNLTSAMNWYRLAWGVPQDDLVFKSEAEQQTQSEIAKIESEKRRIEDLLLQKDRQIKLLSSQIDALQTQLANGTERGNEMAGTIKELSQLVSELRVQQEQARGQAKALDARIRTRGSSEVSMAFKNADKSTPLSGANGSTSGTSFGAYYALIIGNEKYNNIDNLLTPRSDATRVAELLKEKYGFNVQLLLNSDHVSILDAINNLSGLIREEDNLFIYYAGHGSRLKTGDYESGFWLPIDADPPPRDTLWIANESITRHLARISAKRILVIADSCYAGMLSDAPSFLALKQDSSRKDAYLKYKMPRKSRLLISSGGDKPVLDSGGGDNSVFARALLDVLEKNNDIVSGPELFEKVKNRVSGRAKETHFVQTPEFKVIKGAGHEMGDFFFVPAANNSES